MDDYDNMIASLYQQLGHYAYEWRCAAVQHHNGATARAVKGYHEVMAQLWRMGHKGEDLGPEDELPQKLMPDYFVQYWDTYYALLRELSDLARNWKILHDKQQDHGPEAKQLVRHYHSTLVQLWEHAGNPVGIVAESCLPNDLMPDFYLKHFDTSMH